MLFLASGFSVLAQDKTRVPADTANQKHSQPTSKKHSYFLIGLDYGSNFTYKDRAGQTTYPYLYPNVTYHAKSGFFASAGAFRVSNVQQDYNVRPFVELDLSAGWNHNFGENAEAGLSYLYSAYNRNLPLISTALSNDLNAFYDYDFDIIDARLSFDYAFGKLGGDSVVTTRKVPGKKGKKTRTLQKATFFTSSDYFFNLDFSHEFSWEKLFRKNDALSITPEIYISAGTNNFYNNYYKQVKALDGKLKKNQLVSNADTISDPYDASAAAFKLREYVLSLPIGYSIGEFTMTPQYDYIIPVNQPSFLSTPLKPYSLFKFSISYKIK
jgi:hypothetical protein